MTSLTLEHVIARAMSDLRNQRGWTQSDLAHQMRTMGVKWSANRVTQLETLRGKVGLYEVVALTWLFEVPISRLLAGAEDIAAPDGETTIPLQYVRNALNGDSQIQDQSRNAAKRAREDTAEIRRIAQGLGLPTVVLSYLAKKIWGHAFTVERDIRAGDVSALPKRSAQAKRGHATRALTAEVSAYLEKTGMESVLADFNDHAATRGAAVRAKLQESASDQHQMAVLGELLSDGTAVQLDSPHGLRRMGEALKRLRDLDSEAGPDPKPGQDRTSFLLEHLPRGPVVAGEIGEDAIINSLVFVLDRMLNETKQPTDPSATDDGNTHGQ